MLKWAPFPFLRVAFFLSAGIFTYLKLGKQPDFIFPLFAFFIALYLSLWTLARFRKSSNFNNLAGISALVAIYLAGFLLTHYRTAQSNPDNIIHITAPIQYYEGVVDDYITQKTKTIATTLRLTKLKTNKGWQTVSGSVRITIAKENTPLSVTYGDILVIKGAPTLVKPPANPAQFDYRKYLANQQIYHQHYLSPHQLVITGHQPTFAWMEWSIQIRDYLDGQLRKNIPSAREYAIATALVLGIKDYLPDDIKSTYTNTGTMHVLAVSGLHVALLFYILNLLIGKWSQRLGYRIASFVILLSLIWVYAFVTALSASVLRAVVMFTFILIADTFRKQTNIYNTLSATAFFLLLFNPYYLVEVGFQLSFLAVFGIVYLQPKIYNWLELDGWLPDNTWKLISTSIAAQVAVLPLSFYYFHQFPVYFLLANIIAIPLSNAALILGFVLLLLCWLPVIPGWLGLALAGCLSLMNYLSGWLLKFPLAVINNISVNQTQTWLLYTILVIGTLFLARKRLFYFAVFTLLLITFSGWRLAESRNQKYQNYMVVYQVSRATALSFMSGNQAVLLADSAFYAQPKNYQYAVQPHLVKAGITNINFDTISHLPKTRRHQLASTTLPDGNMVINWRGKRILLCRQAFKKYFLANLKPDYVILTNNAYFAPATLPNKNEQVVVILASSNYNWYRKKMKALFADSKVKLHDIKEQGAFIVP